ncbi:MAG: inositol monophosphatase family protein [Actinomycetota bacterium]
MTSIAVDGEGHRDVELALHLADVAADIARPLFESGVRVEQKPDGSPVTAADFAVERELTRMLHIERPDDAWLSEEAGSSGHSHRRWIIDPIDGTEQFVARQPSWGSHVALEIDGCITVGVITRPMRRLRWWAAQGGGAHRCREGQTGTGHRLRVSAVPSLRSANVSVWAEGPSPIAECLSSRTRLVEPGYDDYIDLIEGHLDAIVFPRIGVARVWDHAPAVVLTKEAGGRFRDPRGGTSINDGTGVFTNGLVDDDLDDAIVALMAATEQ